MKRSDIKRRPLSRTVLEALEPEAKEYRENYGTDRLYFVVNPSGNKRWELRYKRHDGKWGWHGLGSFRDVSAESARNKAIEINNQLKLGVDVIKQRKEQAEAGSPKLNFKSIAAEWIEDRKDKRRAPKTISSMEAALKNDIFPVVGHKQITEVTRAECLKIQSSIEKRNALNTAEKVRVWLNEIFRFAIAKGYCDINGAVYLVDVSTPTPESSQYPHLLEKELPAFLNKLAASKSGHVIQYAAWLTIYTASRPGMVRFAEWSELDFEEQVWHVPAAKMKTGVAHTVPLTSQVICILLKLRELTGRSKYLFPGQGSVNAVISENTINKCFALIGYKDRITGHGSRHTASTLLSEHGWPSTWRSAQLAHAKKGLERIYNKAEFIERRRVMMQWYCDYLDYLKEGMSANRKEELAERVRAAHAKYPRLKDEDD